MSSIPPNIMGSVFQAQVAAAETARKSDAQRNKRVADSRELARLADQTISEVEDTDQTEEAIVRRQDEKQHDGQDAHDTWQQHRKRESGKLYTPDGQTNPDDSPPPDSQSNPPSSDPSDPDDPPEHIDLSA